MKEQKKVLCGYCKKPIHIDSWGGVQKDKGFFHAKCHLDAENEVLNIDDVGESFYCCKVENNESKCDEQCQFCIDWVDEANQ